MRRRPTVTSPGRCSAMAKRNSMRDGPLAQLFKATEGAQSPEVEEQPPAAPREAPRPKRQQSSRPQLIDLPEPEDSGGSRFPSPEGQPYLAAITVVGVGGGGCNAVNRMIESD